jgi:hypothetical protein
MQLIRTLLAACAVAAAQPAPPVKQATVPLSVCDVLSQPLLHDGHLLTVRGRLQSTDEGVWLAGDHCAAVLTTEGHVWPEVIALTMPGNPQSGRLHPVDFAFNWESKRDVDSQYKQLLQQAPEKCIVFTVTGLFETRQNWSTAKLTYPDGTSKLAGFGHVGEALGQLVLRSEEGVALAPNCKVGAHAHGQ